MQEGSKIFDKWAPSSQQVKEQQEKSSSLLSRSLKKILGGSVQQSKSQQQQQLQQQQQQQQQSEAFAAEPLMLFDPSYNFLHPDSVDNLVFLDTETKDGIPIIRFEFHLSILRFFLWAFLKKSALLC